MTGASKVQWSRPHCIAGNGDAANLPCARSGHTLSVTGNTGFLFGGLCSGPLDNKIARPVDELHILRMGKSELEWCFLAFPENARPLPRWRHSACIFDDTHIVIFGGYHTASLRLSDVWLFNTIAMEWQKAKSEQAPGFNSEGSHPPSTTWPGIHEPLLR
mmetsp:Transcript_35007/g.107501  ORF Transcript_35007/g.107501 Transcript_35007/m.107501 type:complete len:160 (+) Transcript_35007:147-626(+)